VSNSVWVNLVERLRAAGIPFEAGLTEAELQSTEGKFGFRFPPDLRAFLQAGLPVGERFPNWRNEPEASLRKRLRIPAEGILFDVEHNGFWLSEWGPRPDKLEEAQALVEKLVATAPVLIPVYSHRMMPDRPHESGNPVFSVHQTDIIHYGVDLQDYFLHEFLSKDRAWPEAHIRQIEFWDLERFLSVRWKSGYAIFDNRDGKLP
jgi:hypothetical protein